MPPTEVAPAAPSRWRRARLLVGRLAAIYVAVCLVMMACETRLVYAPPPLVPDFETRVVDAEDAMLASADGTKLHGLLFRAAGSAEAVLYCHGNGEDVAHDVELARHYRDLLGANVLVFDYRGYGKSEG